MANPYRTVPAAAIAPPPRCYHRGDNQCGPLCGELASYMRGGRDWFGISYFCEKHSAPGDVPIQPEHVFRRVKILCNVMFAGVATNAPVAQTEAVARLEAIVREAGGALVIHEVHSLMVRAVPQAGPRPELAGQGSRE